MTPEEQLERFDAELRALINRYREEYDLGLLGMIGTLETAKLDVYTVHTKKGEEQYEQ